PLHDALPICCGRGASRCGAAGAGVGVGGAATGFGRTGAAGSTRSSGRENFRFFVSTTTAFVRPCEKFWRTVPCSGRFSVSVFFGLTLSVLSSPVFVSVIPHPLRRPPHPTLGDRG